ncbi:MAG: bifunctional nuclease family protein [Planctomycetota bacterium]
MTVRMELARILIRELNDYQLIELREALEDGSREDASARSFPIVIGLPEAMAIDRRLKGIEISRPQTHDLLASVIEELGGRLESITLTDLSDQTFFATLDVRTPGGEVKHIDSRPSDAIALGVSSNVPIYVAEHVLAAASADTGRAGEADA